MAQNRDTRNGQQTEIPLREQVDQLCEELERTWRNGERTTVETWFVRYPEVRADPVAALDLVFQEYLLRERLGEKDLTSEYVARFPDLAERFLIQLEVHQLIEEPAQVLIDWPDLPGYQILSELGRGGMGVVYLARQKTLGRNVALKVVRGDLLSAEALARFQAEAGILARFQHPNIVQVFEVGQWSSPTGESLPYLTLEWVPGGSLADRLRDGPVAADLAACWMEDLARAVAIAHEAGVIHRDLKPANVLLNEETPKLTDFGLARQQGQDLERLTTSGAIVGTPAYMAPEQARARPAEMSPAVDIYSLGAVLYECLTGRPPFLGTTTLETLAQVLTEDPVPPRRLRPGIPRDLETICLKCLEKNPAQRYASALTLAEDLQRFRAGQPVLARPLSPWQRVGRWARRRPAIAGLVGALVLALTLGIAGVGWQWLRAEAAAEQARQERDRSEANFRLLLEMNTDVVDLAEKLRPLAGTRIALVQDILQRTQVRHDRFLAEVGPLPPVLAARARMLTAFSELQMELRSTTLALQQADEAVTLFRRLLDEQQEDAESSDWRVGLGLALERRGYALLQRGESAAAREDQAASLAIRRPLAEAEPDNLQRQLDLAASLQSFGVWFTEQGQPEQADEYNRQALEIKEQVVARGLRTAHSLSRLALAHEQIGEAEWARRNDAALVRARDSYRQSLDLNRQAAQLDPTNTDYLRHVCRVQMSYGSAQHKLRLWKDAEKEITQAAEIIRFQIQANPGHARWEDQLARVESLLEGVRGGESPSAETFKRLQGNRDRCREALRRDPHDNYERAFLAAAWMELAEAHLRQAAAGIDARSNHELARGELAEALPLAEQAHRKDPGNATHKLLLARIRGIRVPGD